MECESIHLLYKCKIKLKKISTENFNYDEFKTGMVLLIDKPKDWTSFDALNYIKKIGKVKIGHAGTLDPLATGLLIACTGNYTKKISEFMGLEKTYTGTFVFGATTASFDLEKPVDRFAETKHLNETNIKEAFQHFIGKQFQTAPAFSAKKIEGERAYEKARQGIEVEMKPHEIEIHELNLLSVHKEENLFHANFILRCSKGTFVRSLARDIALKLNTAAYLDNLRRTKIGNYSVEDALGIKEWKSLILQNIV